MSENTTIDPEQSSFHCSAEWHLIKYGAATLAVYNLAYRLSHTRGNASGVFHASAVNIGAYFQLNRKTVYHAFENCDAEDFFDLRKSGKALFESNEYGVRSHEERAKVRPGECCQKPERTIAFFKNDPLGRQLRAIAGGKINFMPLQIENFRKLGLSNDDAAALWRLFLNGVPDCEQTKKWRKSAPIAFWEWLKVVKHAETKGTTVSRFALAPDLVGVN